MNAMRDNRCGMRGVAGFLLALLLGTIVCSCGGGGNASSTGDIGSVCNADNTNACSGISGGFCNQLSFCTRQCNYHSDCGCASGTTTGDISEGKCSFSCETVTGGSFCTTVCATTSDCSGTSTCDSNGNGYSVCD